MSPCRRRRSEHVGRRFMVEGLFESRRIGCEKEGVKRRVYENRRCTIQHVKRSKAKQREECRLTGGGTRRIE